MQLVQDSAIVLVAIVPKGGTRWKQVHLNTAVLQQFFQITSSGEKILLEHMRISGAVHCSETRPLVFSDVNKNLKIEFDFDGADYPSVGVPILLVLEVDPEQRRFRYLLLMPRDEGYVEMAQLNAVLKPIGRGFRRVITTIDEVEMRWVGCPLRGESAPPPQAAPAAARPNRGRKMNAIQTARDLLAEAVRSDGVLHVTYPLTGMGVTVGEREWESQGSTRKQVEMEEALRNLQANGFLDEKPFGMGINNNQAILRPTAKAYQEFA